MFNFFKNMSNDSNTKVETGDEENKTETTETEEKQTDDTETKETPEKKEVVEKNNDQGDGKTAPVETREQRRAKARASHGK